MKTKLLTIKSLLVAVGLCVGQSVWATEGDVIYSNDFSTNDQTHFATWTATSKKPTGFSYAQIGRSGTFSISTGALVHTSDAGKSGYNTAYANANYGFFNSTITEGTKSNYVLEFDVTLAITANFAGKTFFEVSDASNKVVICLYANHTRGGSTSGSTTYGYIVSGDNGFAVVESNASASTNAEGTLGNGTQNTLATVSETTGSKTYHVKLDAKAALGTATLTIKEGETAVVDEVAVNITAGSNLKAICFEGTNNYQASMTTITFDNLSITEGAATVGTYYTATFTDNTSGNDVTSSTTIYSDLEKTTPVSNSALEDGNTYYFTTTQTAYVDYEGSFTVNGAAPAISFSMTAQPTYTYTVNAVDGSSNILATLASSSSYNTASVNYAYPEYINVNGTLYTKAATSQVYGTSFTLSSDAQVENATYSASDYTNVIYYVEAEAITGMTASNSGQGDARCSNRYGAYAASDVEFITLPAGTYKIYAGYCGGEGTTFTIKAGEATVWSAATTGSRGEADGENFTVDGSTPLTIAQAGGANVLLDNIIIQKVSTTNEVIGTADYTTTFLGQKKAMTINKGQTINVTFKNHGGSSQWFNWLVRFYTTGLDNTLRADNFVLGDADATNGTRSVKLNDTDVSDWAAFTTDMANATVDMAIAYTAAGMFSITATAVGGGNTYTHSYSYNTALTNAINLELGVEKSWMEITSYDVVNPTSVSATLGANGYATFASAYPLDLTTANLPSGVTAYKAAVSGTTVTFTPLNQTVPANTGVLLKGPEDAEVSIPVATSGTDVTENAFLVNTVGTTFAADDGYTYFGMMKAASSSDAIIFGTFDPSSVAIPANKAYLKVLTSSIATAPSLTFIFDDGQTTGIESVKAEGRMLNGSAEYYNLAGQRVAQPTKGLYIVNGRKVVVK